MKDQQRTVPRILADNYTVAPQAEVTYIGWLTQDSTQKRSSSMGTEFSQPEMVMANVIIFAGFLWEGLIHVNSTTALEAMSKVLPPRSHRFSV